MGSKKMVEVNGKKYISSKLAAEAWEITQGTVADYCRTGRIKDCWKDACNRWFIAIDTIKPLSNAEVQRLLFLVLQLKNDPTLEINWSMFTFDRGIIDLIYSNLVYEGYLKPFDIQEKERIPYEVILTQRGMEVALPRRHCKTDVSFSGVIAQWAPTVVGIAQLVVQIAMR